MPVLKKVKDFLGFLTPLIGLIPIVLQFQPYLNLRELTSLLFLVGFVLLILMIYLIFDYSKLLVKSVPDGPSIKLNALRIFFTLLGNGIILYFLINRSVNFLNLLQLCLVYFPIIAFSIAIPLYLLIKRTNLNAIKRYHNIKTILIFTIVASNVVPFVFGASFSSGNPLVDVSCQPMEILYDKGNQVQNIKSINVYVKGLEGNARNVTIYIQAPANIYYWVDEIQNGTKTIDYLLFDDVNQFILKIQPSISVGNGTYDIEVHWTYQSDLGINYSNYKVIKVFVGPYLFESPMILFSVVVAISVGAASVVYYLIARRRKHLKPINP